MNKLKVFTFFFCTFFTLALFGQLSVVTDRSDANYTVGESMNFVVSGGSGSVNYTIHYDHGVTPAIASGTVFLNGGSGMIPFQINEPSVVLCSVTSNGQFDVAGAAFSPFSIKEFEADPTDFDAFWQNQKNQLATVPMSPVIAPLVPDFDTRTRDYRINLGQIDGRRIYGYLSIPDRPGTFPAVITHAAFGVGPNICVPRPEIAADIGVISLSIWMHDAEPDTQAPGAYFPKNWDNPIQNYFRYGVLGIVRAIDYIYTMPEFRGQGIGLNGVSEGGGMSILAAGIDERVTAVSASIFAHSEHSGFKYGRASGFPNYLFESQVVNQGVFPESINVGAKYFDALRAAKRFDGAFLGAVGYIDLTSIPATNFGTYNQLKGSTVLIHKVKGGHQNPQEFYLGKFEFFRKNLGTSGEKGYAANAGFDQNLNSQDAFLSGVIEKNGINNFSLPVEWKMISGSGQVVFSNKNDRNTAASFSENGEYLLRFTATDKSMLVADKTFFTISDHVKITVSGNVASTDVDNDGFDNSEDCNDFNPNIGAPGTSCDDGDPNTQNDILQSDCSCRGTTLAPCASSGGDSDGDGYCANVDCNDFNPQISAAGDVCDDGDANTQNDVIQSDCSCAGTAIPPPPTGCNVNFSANGLKLTVEPLNDLINFVKIYDLNYNLLMSCEEWSDACDETQEFNLPAAGEYFLQILTYSDWSTQVCGIFEKIDVDGLPNPPNVCQNITNGGLIGGDEAICPDENPSMIISETLPSGGNGAVEYLWLSSDLICPDLLSDSISGAHNSTFELGQLSKTTYFRRLSRRAGCDDWFAGASNCVVKILKTDCDNDTPCDAGYAIDGNEVAITGIGKPIATVKIIDKFTHAEMLSCNNFIGACPSDLTIDLVPGKYFIQIITGAAWGEDYLCNIFEEFEIFATRPLARMQGAPTVQSNDFPNFSKNKKEPADILIYPNPARDFIQVSINHFSRASAKIELINRLGKTEKTGSLSADSGDSRFTFSTEKLASGIYFIKVSGVGEQPIVKKIFVE